MPSLTDQRGSDGNGQATTDEKRPPQEKPNEDAKRQVVKSKPTCDGHPDHTTGFREESVMSAFEKMQAQESRYIAPLTRSADIPERSRDKRMAEHQGDSRLGSMRDSDAKRNVLEYQHSTITTIHSKSGIPSGIGPDNPELG